MASQEAQFVHCASSRCDFPHPWAGITRDSRAPASGISQAQLEYALGAFHFAISISTFCEFIKFESDSLKNIENFPKAS